MNALLSGLEKMTVKLKAANVNNGILKSVSRKYKKTIIVWAATKV